MATEKERRRELLTKLVELAKTYDDVGAFLLVCIEDGVLEVETNQCCLCVTRAVAIWAEQNQFEHNHPILMGAIDDKIH